MEAEWTALCPPDPIRDCDRMMVGLPIRLTYNVRVVGVHKGKRYS